MEADFWLQRWHHGEIGFHQGVVNGFLAAHWPAVGVAPGGFVFVPLCGKSVDLAWLAARGHRVIGAELSPVASAAFFAEAGLRPQQQRTGDFDVYSAEGVTIWCGDFFALPLSGVPEVAAVYDRAALVAMPEVMQPAYAEKLVSLARGAPILLVSLTYPYGEAEGPPFSISDARVRKLFPGHDVALLAEQDGLPTSPAMQRRGVTSLMEAVYLLRPKTEAQR